MNMAINTPYFAVATCFTGLVVENHGANIMVNAINKTAQVKLHLSNAPSVFIDAVVACHWTQQFGAVDKFNALQVNDMSIAQVVNFEDVLTDIGSRFVLTEDQIKVINDVLFDHFQDAEFEHIAGSI